MVDTATAAISQIALLLTVLAGFVFVLAQADGADRPIARYRATSMLIFAVGAAFALKLPILFQKWGFVPTTIWTSSSIGLAIILLINVGLIAWTSKLLLTEIGQNKTDHWVWQLFIISNAALILCLSIMLALQFITGFSVSLLVLTSLFFAAVLWQISMSIYLFRQVIVERV